VSGAGEAFRATVKQQPPESFDDKRGVDQVMRKFMIAMLSFVVGFYLFINETGKPVPNTTTPQPLSATLSDDLTEAADPDPSNALAIPKLATPGSKSLIAFDESVDPLLTSERNVESLGDQDERAAALSRLADHNNAQLYTVLWQTLEDEGLDDVYFQEFVRATLLNLDDHAPGEVLAALVQSAPTPELRLNALRLITEACQELSIDLFNRALSDPDPSMRRFAMDYFEELSADALFDAVTDAVHDHNRGVRLVAFSTLEDMHEFAPIWEVADSVLNDPDPQIRMRGLELLAYGDPRSATDYLLLALSDPDPRVIELAKDLLVGLEVNPS
jgi:hypothetical protein